MTEPVAGTPPGGHDPPRAAPLSGYRLAFFRSDGGPLTPATGRAYLEALRALAARTGFGALDRVAASHAALSEAEVDRRAATHGGAPVLVMPLEGAGVPVGLLQRDLFRFATALADELTARGVPTAPLDRSVPGGSHRLVALFRLAELGDTGRVVEPVVAGRPIEPQLRGTPIGVRRGDGVVVAGVDHFRSAREGRRVETTALVRREDDWGRFGLPVPLLFYPGPGAPRDAASDRERQSAIARVMLLTVGAVAEVYGHPEEEARESAYANTEDPRVPGAVRVVFDPARFPPLDAEGFERFARAAAAALDKVGEPAAYIEADGTAPPRPGLTLVSEDYDGSEGANHFAPDSPLRPLTEPTAGEDPGASYRWRLGRVDRGWIDRAAMAPLCAALRAASRPQPADPPGAVGAVRRVLAGVFEKPPRASVRVLTVEFGDLGFPAEEVVQAFRVVVRDVCDALDGALHLPPLLGPGAPAGRASHVLNLVHATVDGAVTPFGMAADAGDGRLLALAGPSYADSRPCEVRTLVRLVAPDDPLEERVELPPLVCLHRGLEGDEPRAVLALLGAAARAAAPALGPAAPLLLRQGVLVGDDAPVLQLRAPLRPPASPAAVRSFVEEVVRRLDGASVGGTVPRPLRAFLVARGAEAPIPAVQLADRSADGGPTVAVLADYDLTAWSRRASAEPDTRALAAGEPPFLVRGTLAPGDLARFGPDAAAPRWGLYLAAKTLLGAPADAAVARTASERVRRLVGDPDRARALALLRVLAARTGDAHYDLAHRRLTEHPDPERPLAELARLVGHVLRDPDHGTALGAAALLCDEELAGRAGVLAALPRALVVLPPLDAPDLGLGLLHHLASRGWADGPEGGFLAWLWPVGPGAPGDRWEDYPACLAEPGADVTERDAAVFRVCADWAWRGVAEARERGLPGPHCFVEAAPLPALAAAGLASFAFLGERLGADGGHEVAVRLSFADGRFSAFWLSGARHRERLAGGYYRARPRQLVLEGFVAAVLRDLVAPHLEDWERLPAELRPGPPVPHPRVLPRPGEARAPAPADPLLAPVRLVRPRTVPRPRRVLPAVAGAGGRRGSPAPHWVPPYPRWLPIGHAVSAEARALAAAEGIVLEPGMTCVRGHVSPHTAAAHEAVGQRLRVTRAVDVLEQVLRRSALGAVAAPAG